MQLESILACRDTEATASTMNHGLDKISLSQKLDLRDRQAPTDDVKDLDEGDENINLGGLSEFRSVLSTNKAVFWLANRLRNRSSLQWGSDETNDLEVHRVRQTILAALPTSTISKREPPRQHQVSFRLEWGHIISRLPQDETDGRQAIAMTVCSGKAQVTSVKEYLQQTWPWSGWWSCGSNVLDLLRRTTWFKQQSPDASGGKECSSSGGKLESPRC